MKNEIQSNPHFAWKQPVEFTALGRKQERELRLSPPWPRLGLAVRLGAMFSLGLSVPLVFRVLAAGNSPWAARKFIASTALLIGMFSGFLAVYAAEFCMRYLGPKEFRHELHEDHALLNGKRVEYGDLKSFRWFSEKDFNVLVLAHRDGNWPFAGAPPSIECNAVTKFLVEREVKEEPAQVGFEAFFRGLVESGAISK